MIRVIRLQEEEKGYQKNHLYVQQEFSILDSKQVLKWKQNF